MSTAQSLPKLIRVPETMGHYIPIETTVWQFVGDCEDCEDTGIYLGALCTCKHGQAQRLERLERNPCISCCKHPATTTDERGQPVCESCARDEVDAMEPVRAIVHYAYHFDYPDYAACCGRGDLEMTYQKRRVNCERCKRTVTFQEHGANDVPSTGGRE